MKFTKNIFSRAFGAFFRTHNSLAKFDDPFNFFWAETLRIEQLINGLFWSMDLRNGPADQYPFCIYDAVAELGDDRSATARRLNERLQWKSFEKGIPEQSDRLGGCKICIPSATPLSYDCRFQRLH